MDFLSHALLNCLNADFSDLITNWENNESLPQSTANYIDYDEILVKKPFLQDYGFELISSEEECEFCHEEVKKLVKYVDDEGYEYNVCPPCKKEWSEFDQSSHEIEKNDCEICYNYEEVEDTEYGKVCKDCILIFKEDDEWGASLWNTS